eukprot:5466508-Pleurochrysis_carterae.AAC.1
MENIKDFTWGGDLTLHAVSILVTVDVAFINGQALTDAEKYMTCANDHFSSRQAFWCREVLPLLDRCMAGASEARRICVLIHLDDNHSDSVFVGRPDSPYMSDRTVNRSVRRRRCLAKVVVISIYQFIQSRIRSAVEQLRHANTGNGGARRRARAFLSRRLARPSSGTDRRFGSGAGGHDGDPRRDD